MRVKHEAVGNKCSWHLAVADPEFFFSGFTVFRYLNSEGYEVDKKELEQLFSSIESNYYEWASYFPLVVIDKNDSESVKLFGESLKRMKPENVLALAKTVFLSDYCVILEKVVAP
ncbi:karrikin insensitive 2 receptor CA-like [Bidens hawaiensis]|uniref:karrikin insensitive 2 receptor CA-like n=1 Tax=Bidens hawaiensis TaxID=980011 RepID=UPI00404969C8